MELAFCTTAVVIVNPPLTFYGLACEQHHTQVHRVSIQSHPRSIILSQKVAKKNLMNSALWRCDIDICIRGRGIEHHAETDKHKLNFHSEGTFSWASFCTSPCSPINKVMAAKLCKLYHAVKHHLSYRSLDCGAKVDREI